MHLVVDIGNTETVLGLVIQSGEVREHWRLTTGTARTADEFDHLVHSLLARKGFDADDPDPGGAGVRGPVHQGANEGGPGRPGRGTGLRGGGRGRPPGRGWMLKSRKRWGRTGS